MSRTRGLTRVWSSFITIVGYFAISPDVWRSRATTLTRGLVWRGERKSYDRAAHGERETTHQNRHFPTSSSSTESRGDDGNEAFLSPHSALLPPLSGGRWEPATSEAGQPTSRLPPASCQIDVSMTEALRATQKV